MQKCQITVHLFTFFFLNLLLIFVFLFFIQRRPKLLGNFMKIFEFDKKELYRLHTHPCIYFNLMNFTLFIFRFVCRVFHFFFFFAPNFYLKQMSTSTICVEVTLLYWILTTTLTMGWNHTWAKCNSLILFFQ